MQLNPFFMIDAGFALAMAAVCHFWFSPLGFNPTDEGWFLAIARRLSDGQVPYRDFITSRPLLTALLRIPFIRWAPDHLFLYSRATAWVEFALVAWSWQRIAGRCFNLALTCAERWLMLVAIFVATVQVFPVMVWYSVDALFFFSIGIAMAISTIESIQMAGWFCVGLAALCKQTFVVMGPVALFFFAGKKRARAFLCWILPGVLYGAWLWHWHVLGDALSSFVALGGGILYLTRYAFRHAEWLPWGFAMGILAGLNRWRWVAIALMLLGTWSFVYWDSFATFGFGLALGLVYLHKNVDPGIPILWIGLILSVVVTLSGYDKPDLAIGILCAYFFAWSYRTVANAPATRQIIFGRSALGLSAIGLALVFPSMRRQHVYMDAPAQELTYPLGDLLPGGKGLYTNKRTYAVLQELKAVLAKRHNITYAILPDFPGYWALAKDRNPLPLDWAHPTEFVRGVDYRRLTASLMDKQGKLSVAVLMVRPYHLGYAISKRPYHPIVAWLQEHYRRVLVTPYVDLYE